MVSQITNGIKIIVRINFQGTYFKKYRNYYAFTYRITIENHSNDIVQLLTRHWIIMDALNDKEYVEGEGVLGKKPVIKPGDSHTYDSFCLLHSPIGAMKGFFKMINYSNSSVFNVTIPKFKLNAPFALN